MSVSEPTAANAPPRWDRKFWKRVGWIVLGLAGLQFVDPYLTYTVLAAGVVLRQVGALARLHDFFREMGTVYTPLVIAIVLVILSPKPWGDKGRYASAVKLLLAVAISAGACQLLQWGFGKQRISELVEARLAGSPTTQPNQAGSPVNMDRVVFQNIRQWGVPGVEYRPLARLLGPEGTRGYTSMPSSHTVAAFVGFLVLARLVPALTPLCWVLAVGCGLSRIWTLDHYFSDVLAGALLAWLLVRLLERPLQLTALPDYDHKLTASGEKK